MFLVDIPSRKALLGVLLGFAMMFGTDGVVAAPHRSGGKSEPAQLIRSPAVAVAGRAAAQSYQFNTWPATASLLLLRVEFPADTDSLTTGTGQWADAEYAHDGDVNHWVVKNGIDETLTAPVAFGTASTAGAISRYYQEVSYGLLTVEVTVSSSIYLMPNAMGYYGSNETGVNGYAALISDVESLVLSENLNAFDSVMIVHAGAGEETDIADDGGVTGDTPSDIWSAHILGTKYTIVPQTGTQDCGTPAQGFVGACDSAPPLNAVVDPLGVMVHEFAHWLGLPDLYNTLTGGQVIGDWGLMDTGLYNRDQATNIFGSAPAHPIVWSKIQLGWLSPSSVSEAQEPAAIQLAPINEIDGALTIADRNQRVFKLQSSYSQPLYYFLIENRVKTGFDQGLPGEGMLVWSVNGSVADSVTNQSNNTVNFGLPPRGVLLVEADGDNAIRELNSTDYGSPSDPFPGAGAVDVLSPTSSPSSQPLSADGWLNLTEIVSSVGSVDFTLGFGPEKVVLHSVSHSCGGSSLNWSEVSALDLDRYNIYRDGQLVSQTTATSYLDSAGTGNNLYQVSAVDVLGNEGSKSNGLIANSYSCGSQGGGGGGSIGYLPLLILLFLTRRARKARALPEMR